MFTYDKFFFFTSDNTSMILYHFHQKTEEFFNKWNSLNLKMKAYLLFIYKGEIPLLTAEELFELPKTKISLL